MKVHNGTKMKYDYAKKRGRGKSGDTTSGTEK